MEHACLFTTRFLVPCRAFSSHSHVRLSSWGRVHCVAMGVELYFVKRDDDGPIAFPCWTDVGEPLPHHTFFAVTSLKWAQGDPRLAGTALLNRTLDPQELIDAATRGLGTLLEDYLALDPNLCDGSRVTVDVALEVFAQVEHEWVGDPEVLRGLHRDTTRHRALFLEALSAGRRGYSGYWSY